MRPESNDSHGSAKSEVRRRQRDTDVEAQRFLYSDERKLGIISTALLIINQMIGTGIFSAPAAVFSATGSVGVSLIFWLIGGILAFCGLSVYLEFGLAMPRSGGEKNYLERIYRRPKYLTTCILAAQMILLGFSSGNAIAFGQMIVNACNSTMANESWAARAIGISCVTFAILLHSLFPQWGIRLMNIMGMFKVVVMLVIAFSGFAALAGYRGTDNPHNVEHSFSKTDMVEYGTGGFHAYSNAMFSIIYSFSGWESANYVLSEVRSPRRTLAIAAPLAVGIVTFLYMLANIAYFAAVEKLDLATSDLLVAALFFKNMFGESAAAKTLPVFVAVSNLGSVLATSFAHSRLTQELGKERILPFGRLWASNKPCNAPTASLILHWTITMIVVAAPPLGQSYDLIIELLRPAITQAMDGLDEFEKQLAADKAERERSEKRDDRKKHRHRHRDDDRRDDHRHKRRRRSRHDEHDERRPRHSHRDKEPSDRHRESDEKPAGDAPTRDAWMTAPSALDIEHIHRPAPKEKTPPKEPERVISAREINRGLNQPPVAEPSPEPKERVIDYTFGDSGSSWRMTKLRGVYSMAEDTGRPLEDIAVERFGSLAEFDDAREERQELDRAKSYGKGYSMKEKPTGEFYTERLAKQKAAAPSPRAKSPEPAAAAPAATVVTAPMDQTALNRLRAAMMKAKLRRAPNAAQLEEEYNRAAAGFSSSASAAESVVIGGQDSRLLAGHIRNEVKSVDNKRGRERGTVVANEDMTIDDMLREERRTKGQAGGEGMRLAERIAKDGKFDDDLDYMDENAEKLAKRVHKSEMNLKNMAVNEFQKVNRILENCPLCHHEDTNTPPLAPVLALATRVFLTLATEPEISPGGAVIVPTTHRRNLLECDDDEWEEMRNFMKSLTRMYHAQGRDVLFYENAAAPGRHLHAAMMAVPIPYEEGATAPAYFQEAFLSADEEWSQHKKIIDTGAKARDGLGRMAFRQSLTKEMPYFHVWFTLDGGLGHIVEDAGRWPKGDIFAREVIGGIVDAEPHIVKKQGRWHRSDPRAEGFQKEWRKFDWTRVLAEG